MFNWNKMKCEWSGHRRVTDIHEKVIWSDSQKKFYVEISGKCSRCNRYYDITWEWLTPTQYIQYVRENRFDKAVDSYDDKEYLDDEILWCNLNKKLETKRNHRC